MEDNIRKKLEQAVNDKEQSQPDPNKHRFESREETLDIRPVFGAPRHKTASGKVPLSLPKPGPGEMCPLCGGMVVNYSEEAHRRAMETVEMEGETNGEKD